MFYNEDSGLTESCDCGHETQGRAPLKVHSAGNSLAAQCPGFCTFTAGVELTPWLGNKEPTFRMVQPKKKKKSKRKKKIREHFLKKKKCTVALQLADPGAVQVHRPQDPLSAPRNDTQSVFLALPSACLKAYHL